METSPLNIPAVCRVPQLPEVLTFAELGMPSVEAATCSVVVTTAGMPTAVVEALSRALDKAVNNLAVATKLSASWSKGNGLVGRTFSRPRTSRWKEHQHEPVC